MWLLHGLGCNAAKMSSKSLLHANPSLGHRYYDLFRSQKFVDCSFTVEQTNIKCHKLILSAASPVFEAMFYGPMSEKHSVEILDISTETFRLMIEYIYTNEVDFTKETIENSIELYYSAEKYILTDLVALCLAAIQKKLRFQNILPTIDLSFHMDLQPLLQLCITFFNKCCLNGYQFMNSLKSNYYHVTKNCLKLMVKLSTPCNQLNCFIREWCHQECKRLGLSEIDYKLVFNDLELTELMQFSDRQKALGGEHNALERSKTHLLHECNHIERVYYKACRPLMISEAQSQISFTLKTDRFISLLGLVINSRLMPRNLSEHNQDQVYFESIDIEIQSEGELIYRGSIVDQKTQYNCDLNIMLDRNIILSSNDEYCIKLFWGRQAFGAEYPCSIQSNAVNGVTFLDHHTSMDCNGSIVKGIKYLNIV